mgnify:CR=1 FL=1
MFYSTRKWIASLSILVGFVFMISQPACDQQTDQTKEQAAQQETQQKDSQSTQRQQKQPSPQQPGQMQQQAPNIEVSDNELEQFVNLQEDLMAIRNNARKKMTEAIQDNGIDIQTFNKISKQMQNAESMKDVDASKSEVQKFQKASKSVMKVQQSIQKEQQKAIDDQDLSVDRFRKIQQAAMQDPELQKRVQNMMRE